MTKIQQMNETGEFLESKEIDLENTLRIEDIQRVPTEIMTMIFWTTINYQTVLCLSKLYDIPKIVSSLESLYFHNVSF